MANFHQIDKAIEAADFTAIQIPDSLHGRIQKLVEIYDGIKPFLTVAAKNPFFPARWQAALTILNQALDALVSSPELAGAGAGGDFKAGKDI